MFNFRQILWKLDYIQSTEKGAMISHLGFPQKMIKIK